MSRRRWSEHRICCLRLFCWFMVAGNTLQGKTWSIVNMCHYDHWPILASGQGVGWLVPWLVGVNCTRTILLCAVETQRWVFRMFPAGRFSGTQGNTDYRARCTMQVFWHLMLKQTLSRSTQGRFILISRAQNNFVPTSCLSHVSSLQSMTLNWARNLLFLLIFIFIDRSAFVRSLWEEILLTRKVLDANCFQISSLKRVPPYYSDNYNGPIHLASCGKQEIITR